MFLYARTGDVLAAKQRTRASLERYQKAVDLGAAVMAADPNEKKVYFEVSDFSHYVFFENPH